MNKSTAKPCAQCPFVLNRTRGYIGPYQSGDDLHAIARQDGVFPCHMTMDTPSETNCRGIALYRKSIAKLQNDPEIQELEAAVIAENTSEQSVPPFQLGQYHSTVRSRMHAFDLPQQGIVKIGDFEMRYTDLKIEQMACRRCNGDGYHTIPHTGLDKVCELCNGTGMK